MRCKELLSSSRSRSTQGYCILMMTALKNSVRVTALIISLLITGISAAKDKSLLEQEDEVFWGRVRALSGGSFSMSFPVDGDCVSDFDTIQTLVETSKGSSELTFIRLCAGSNIKFEQDIDMTGANFDMRCEGGTCSLDGQSKTQFFTAGEFFGSRSTHVVTFMGIDFVDGGSDALSGGAISMVGGKTRIEECEFRNNRGSDGGALWIVDGRVEISNSQFIDNFAEDVGGAMKVEESLTGDFEMVIRDAVFDGNRARTEGDDIYQDNADRAFIDCGEGSDNNFCDASSSNSEISTNFPVSVCAGASTSC